MQFDHISSLCSADGTLFRHYTHIQHFAAQAIVGEKDTKAKQELGYDLPRSFGYFAFKGLKFLCILIGLSKF